MERFRIRILGKLWWLRFCRLQKNNGDCDSPETPSKEIRINEKLTGEEKLRVLIHEFSHAGDWHKSEEWIHEFSTDLARALTKLGYRDDQ